MKKIRLTGKEYLRLKGLSDHGETEAGEAGRLTGEELHAAIDAKLRELDDEQKAEQLEQEVEEAVRERAEQMPRAVVRVEVPEPGEKRQRADGAAPVSKIEQIESWLFQHYDLRRNTVSYTLEFRHKGEGDAAYREMEEEDENDIIYQLKRLGYKKPQDDLQTLLRGSLIATINPVREYYDHLQLHHPGAVRRLADCIVLDDIDMNIDGRNYRELFEEYFEKWLTACYLCNIGVQRNDVMLILIGAQGRFKTSFLNHLCPASMQQYLHCGNINPTISDYNTATYLMERMLINVDDQMENIFGKDYNSMKSVITADFVSRRTLYSKRAKNRRRIANFCGSVNESHFLRDSNNRRYLCFKIKDIRPEYREIDMDEVWAEVKLRADADNRRYVFGKEDFATIDLMNENFMTPSEEDEALHNVFAPAREGERGTYLMQFTEILRVLKSVTNNSQLKNYSLMTAMRKYGFESRSIRADGRAYPCQLFRVRIVATHDELSTAMQMCYRYQEVPAASETEIPY